MKIYFVVPHLEKCGPVNVVLEIVRELRGLCDIYIITIHPEQEKTIKPVFLDLGVEIICLNRGKKESILHASKVARKIEEITLKEKEVIFHAHGHIPALVVSKLNSGRKVVTTHCIAKEDYVFNYGGFIGRLLAWQYKGILNKFDSCVTISKKTYDYYHGLCDDVDLIYNGIDVTKFKPDEKTKSLVRNQLGIPFSATVFIVCGKLINRKNVDSIIRNFIDCFQSKRDKILLIVGDGPMLSQCQLISKSHSNIVFTGYTPDVIKYLQSSDILISSSKSEGMPLAILEGIACGLYPVLSNIQPHEEIINRLPVLKGSLFSIEENPFLGRENMVARTTISHEDIMSELASCFSSASMANQYLELYKKIL